MTTKITATAGIAPNLYLCKVAMDIVAKHVAADQDGVRIAELDEMSYRQMLWDHRPLTDFWRVGQGYARKLEENGIVYNGGYCQVFSGNVLGIFIMKICCFDCLGSMRNFSLIMHGDMSHVPLQI